MALMDKLPPWNKKLAEWLMPYAKFFDVLLVLTALVCLWAVWGWRRDPQYKALWLAFLWSP